MKEKKATINIFCAVWGKKYTNFFQVNTIPSIKKTISILQKHFKVNLIIGTKNNEVKNFSHLKLSLKPEFITTKQFVENKYALASNLLKASFKTKNYKDYFILLGPDAIYPQNLSANVAYFIKNKLSIGFSMAVKINGAPKKRIIWSENLLKNVHTEWKNQAYLSKSNKCNPVSNLLHFQDEIPTNGNTFCPHPLFLNLNDKKINSFIKTWETDFIDHYLATKKISLKKAFYITDHNSKIFSVEFKNKKLKKGFVSEVQNLFKYIELHGIGGAGHFKRNFWFADIQEINKSSLKKYFYFKNLVLRSLFKVGAKNALSLIEAKNKNVLSLVKNKIFFKLIKKQKTKRPFCLKAASSKLKIYKELLSLGEEYSKNIFVFLVDYFKYLIIK